MVYFDQFLLTYILLLSRHWYAKRRRGCAEHFIFVYLFIHYLKRTAHLAAVASLACDPLKHVYIYTNTKHIKQLKGHKTYALQNMVRSQFVLKSIRT